MQVEREVEENGKQESQAEEKHRELWAENVRQGEKEKWDKSRAGVDWWHSAKVIQGEETGKGVMKTTEKEKGDTRHLRWDVQAVYLL